MIVKELIEKLKDLDGDTKVIIEENDSDLSCGISYYPRYDIDKVFVEKVYDCKTVVIRAK